MYSPNSSSIRANSPSRIVSKSFSRISQHDASFDTSGRFRPVFSSSSESQLSGTTSRKASRNSGVVRARSRRSVTDVVKSLMASWSSVLALDACGDCLASASLAAAARASASACSHAKSSRYCSLNSSGLRISSTGPSSSAGSVSVFSFACVSCFSSSSRIRSASRFPGSSSPAFPGPSAGTTTSAFPPGAASAGAASAPPVPAVPV
mmetsp:Transcript_21227/g.46790  ORF Transcript_21227/g.46790 Transcript_21227/m.46790 type:complete len:207 (+) Transcript_21227:2265-2885(+)